MEEATEGVNRERLSHMIDLDYVTLETKSIVDC
jgi:hypothetical protein